MILDGAADAGLNLVVGHIHGDVGVPLPQRVLDINAQIAGKDDDGLAEIDGIALAVRHAAVFEDLQELVQNVRVGFLDLIKEQNAEGVLLDRVGELTAGFVTHIAGRCAHELLIRVALAVFAHVEPDAGTFVAEELFREGLGGLGFADACGARIEQHTLGLCGRGG